MNGGDGGGVSRATLLERRREREVFRQGHRFLDEKRMMVAQELLRQLQHWEDARAELEQVLERARAALHGALLRHGLEEIRLHTVDRLQLGLRRAPDSPFLGVNLVAAPELTERERPGPDPVGASEASDRCAAVFRELLREVPALAAIGANLVRLGEDYTRTERRTRALEDVLLPDLDREISGLDAALEELERDEAVTVRWFGR